MLKKVFVWLFKMRGFTMRKEIPDDLKQYVLIAAPHTSNWDFVYALACFDQLEIPVRFTIKQEWLRWPFKGMMQRLGAIGIERKQHADNGKEGHTAAMAQLFEANSDLVVLVTPEGTRSKRTKWKTGFYHVAKAANVPLVFGYMDYEKKEVGVVGPYHLTGDIETDLRYIMNFFRDIAPKFPEKFSLDVRYS